MKLNFMKQVFGIAAALFAVSISHVAHSQVAFAQKNPVWFHQEIGPNKKLGQAPNFQQG